jgi:hypothetical protein
MAYQLWNRGVSTRSKVLDRSQDRRVIPVVHHLRESGEIVQVGEHHGGNPKPLRSIRDRISVSSLAGNEQKQL